MNHRVIGAALLLAASLIAAAAEELPGRWLEGQSANANAYKLYLPASAAADRMPLVVMLHGCGQTPDVFAESTRMNRLAEQERFLVLYPSQSVRANPARCWNWFLPANQARGEGEPAAIVALVDEIAKQYPVDRQRVYVTGLSAGASMSAILAACYPEVFAAAAMQGGTMYKSATGVMAAGRAMWSANTPDPDTLAEQAWACGGRQRTMMPVMVWQGLGDNIVNRGNGELMVRQFLRFNDLADDGVRNDSVPATPQRHAGQVPQGHAFRAEGYAYRSKPLIEFYQIDAMGHAWSGGKDDLLFSDGKGPDSSRLMWNFFKQFRR